MILIDTDILIWILRNSAKHKVKFNDLAEKYNGELFITPIQYLEIMAGVREKERIDTEIFLDSLGMINIDKSIGKLAGEMMRIYKKSHDLQSADTLIAATAKIYDLKLWTNNQKHYPMMTKNEFIL
jgi:predicted nucleic acid-binding protein